MRNGPSAVRCAPNESAPGLGSPLPHLHRDWARPSHICTGSGQIDRLRVLHTVTPSLLTPPREGPAVALALSLAAPPGSLQHMCALGYEWRESARGSASARAFASRRDPSPCRQHQMLARKRRPRSRTHIAAHRPLCASHQLLHVACCSFRTTTRRADVAAVSPVPSADVVAESQSRCRCGRAEPSPTADVAVASVNVPWYPNDSRFQPG